MKYIIPTDRLVSLVEEFIHANETESLDIRDFFMHVLQTVVAGKESMQDRSTLLSVNGYDRFVEANPWRCEAVNELLEGMIEQLEYDLQRLFPGRIRAIEFERWVASDFLVTLR